MHGEPALANVQDDPAIVGTDIQVRERLHLMPRVLTALRGVVRTFYLWRHF
jgi:hypothetical protein